MHEIVIIQKMVKQNQKNIIKTKYIERLQEQTQNCYTIFSEK